MEQKSRARVGHSAKDRENLEYLDMADSYESSLNHWPEEAPQYEGDEFVIKQLYNGPYDEGVAEIKQPWAIRNLLNDYGLEVVLADKHAVAGLRKAIAALDPEVLKALEVSVRKINPKPPGRPAEPGIDVAEIMRLYRSGLNVTEVAKHLNLKRNRVAAVISAKVRSASSKLPSGRGFRDINLNDIDPIYRPWGSNNTTP